MHRNSCNTPKQPILPFAIMAGAVGFVLVLIWIGAIVVASHNYLAEGADTKLARDLQMPLDTLFRFLAKSSLPHASVLALTISVPVFLFAFITVPILRAWARQSLPQEREDQEARVQE